MAKKKKSKKNRPVDPGSEAARPEAAGRSASLSAAGVVAVPEKRVGAPRSEEERGALTPACTPDVAANLMTTPSRATDRTSTIAGGSDSASPWSVYGTPATGVLRESLTSAFDSPRTAEEHTQEPRDDASNRVAQLIDARQDAEDRVAQVLHTNVRFSLTFPWKPHQSVALGCAGAQRVQCTARGSAEDGGRACERERRPATPAGRRQRSLQHCRCVV